MKYAPASSSTISTTFLESVIDKKYSLVRYSKCEIIRLGINHTYLINVGKEKLILRVYVKEWRSQQEIQAELELLLFLKENNISVSYPIPDKNGKYIQPINAIEGERHAVLFSFAEGETIRNPSEEIYFSLGEMMAKIHQVTIHKTIPRKTYNAQTLVGWADQTLQDFFSEPSEELNYVDRALKIISKKFNEVDSIFLRQGVVHLDIWSDNFKIKNSRDITLFDFDNCGNGWLFLDLAYTIMIMFKDEPDKEIFKKKLERFYNGYGSITSITDQEKELIPYGGLAIWLYYSGIHAQRFDDFSNQFFSKKFLKAWLGVVDKWMNFNGIKV